MVEGLYSGLSPQQAAMTSPSRLSIGGGPRRMSVAGAAAQAAAIEAKMVRPCVGGSAMEANRTQNSFSRQDALPWERLAVVVLMCFHPLFLTVMGHS